MCRNKLLAAGITINNKDFERTVLDGIPDALSAYALQTLMSVHLNGNTLEMKDIIHVISKEADRMRTCHTLKDQSQGQSKANGNKEGHLDEALTATSHSEGGNSRRRRGKCHHCSKEGHWVCKCCTKKQEEAAAEIAAAANQSGQATQMGTSTSPNTSRQENRPIGSANVAYEADSDDGDFWAATMEVEDAHIHCAVSDPLMGDVNDDKDPSCTKPCGAEDDNHLGWANFGVELAKEEDAQDNEVDEWEAFHAETWGVEDEDNTNWAGLEGRPVKKGEECNIKEDAEEEDTPHSESQLAPHNMLHMHAISDDQVPHWALDDEGHTPLNGDGCPRTTSSCGAQVVDTMCHMHCLHDIVCSPECAHLNNPEPAICMHEGQTPGFNANMQAHQAPWPGPGTVTDEQDIHPVLAAQLEGEGLWVPSMSSEQTAAPGTPSISNTPISPASSSKATPSPSEPAPELDVSPSPAESATNAHQEHAPSPSCTDTAAAEIRFDPDPQPGGDGLAHLDTNAPCLAHIPGCPGAFAEDLGESGGVPMVENGASPPLTDPDGTASTFVAKTTDAGAPTPCMPAEAKCSHDCPPWDDPIPKPITHKACTAAQTLSQIGGINVDDLKLSSMPRDHPVPPLTDLAPASAAVCDITCDMPHHKVINTSNWATPAMHPATTLADANGVMAIHWCAKPGHAFPIDSSTMPPLSRRQEDAPPPTIGSRHITAMEALHPHSPISGAFANPNAPTPTSSNNHAAVAFKRDHPPHPPDLLGHQEVEPPSSCATDNTVANAPMPLLSGKEKHFIASPGPRVK